MSQLGALPRARSVDPRTYAAFSGFSCGEATAFEREVNDIVRALYAGVPGVHVRVAEDVDSGALLGLCGIQQRPLALTPPHSPMPDAAYIAVIAVPSSRRGNRLPDGRRIGDFLLDDALAVIRTAWGGGVMPPVWALIDPSNTASHNLFEHHGFGRVPAGPGGKYDVRLRPRGLPLSP
jgi:ribosomal protein S18 acetylase RimI-like enzyme